jgi:hypothetical protein
MGMMEEVGLSLVGWFDWAWESFSVKMSELLL